MLWLAAASGLAVLEATRRIRRKAPVGFAEEAATPRALEVPLCDESSETSCDASLSELRAALTSLSSIASPEGRQDGEEVANCLSRVERALPIVRMVLVDANDATSLVDATELLALMSPSRCGLQPTIIQAGVVLPLVRLLAASVLPVQSLHSAVAGFDSCDPFSTITERHTRHSVEGAPGLSNPETTTNEFGATGPDSRPLNGPSAACILGQVLRTLVNLTSTSKFGTPVRQAVLSDERAVAALLRLLLIEVEPEGSCSLYGRPRAPWQAADAAAAEANFDSTVSAASWQLAGMAAWLVAHLCSAPTGQLQLVQEGIMPLLVRLVRQGRMTWTAYRAAYAAAGNTADIVGAATRGSSSAGSSAEGGPAARPQERSGTSAAASGAEDHSGNIALGEDGGRGGRDQRVRRNQTGSTLLPHGSSALLCDSAAAAAAADGADHLGSSLPFVLAAVQYALMSLVNITFDNSANQRAAAVAGILTELDTLFGELLQPEVLRDARPVPTQAGTQAGITAEEEDGRGHAAEQRARQQLLRTCCQGVAKFAVWLLAHLSSSDPDLKAAITGPGYNFVPRLLAFLMYSEEAEQHSATVAATAVAAPPPSAAASVAAATACMAHDSRGKERTSSPAPMSVIRASQPVLVVRQYAAMALVNLTCGVPSTKAAVAGAMDWAAMANLLQWLAETAMPQQTASADVGSATSSRASTGVPAAPASQSPPAAAAAPPPTPPPTSDLMLYTVWLLQHLSLSPYAAAAADPRVIPPLVVLLRASDPHVRLRSAAALGALCSAAMPPKVSGSGNVAGSEPQPAAAAAAASDSCQPLQPAATGQRQVAGRGLGSTAADAGAEAHPHRAAFLAANGLQRLLAAAHAERDPHLIAYDMLCLSSGVGDDNVSAVAQAVAGGALELLEGLLGSDAAACLVPAAEAMQALARAARNGLRRCSQAVWGGRGHCSDDDAQAAAAAVAAAADHVPRSLLSRVVAVMLTHSDPRVRTAMNDALGALTSLPGVRDRYCAVFAETLRELVSSSEVELRVIPVN